MRIRPEYQLQEIAGKTFIFLYKNGEVDMTRIVSFNASSAWLWKQLMGRDFTLDEALTLLTDHFDGDADTMRQNLEWWIDSLKQEDVITD